MIFLRRTEFDTTQVAVKCDCCRDIQGCFDEREDQSDLGIAHLWMKENGWKSHKMDKWVQFCPSCEQKFKEERARRAINKYLDEFGG